MFAPMIMGTALSSVSDPVATSATVMDVVAVLLWMMAVTSKPMNRDVKGLDVARIIVSAAERPRCCREDNIRSKASRNTSRAKRI